MLFNSLEFAVFLPIVFFLYWLLPSKKLVLLVASYFFYGYWNLKLLPLIIFSSLADFSLSNFIYKEKDLTKKKILLYISIALNIGMLLYFKYFNFFIASFVDVFKFFGNSFSVNTLSIILPVGISFYTFQTLSYTVDVYRGTIKPAKSLLSFLVFVSFFPQLVAGPIEKASHLLPQFNSNVKFNSKLAINGLQQILWGLFKKIVIADNCALIVDYYFENYLLHNGATLIFVVFLFSIQIYGDFSGYSDIGIGVSKLFGIQLNTNFKYPYFARNPYEFWKRWHISLTNWFRDYLYIPLGGNLNPIRNVFIVFIISGLWHGSNWTFVIWGLIHALAYLPFINLKNKEKYKNLIDFNSKTLIKEFLGVILTFCFVMFSWIFFRAKDLKTAFLYINQIGINFKGKIQLYDLAACSPVVLFLLIVGMFYVEWLGRAKQHPLSELGDKVGAVKRFMIYYALLLLIFWFGAGSKSFIYFQF